MTINKNGGKKSLYMFKKSSTLLLKTTLVFMGLIALALAVFALPNFYKSALTESIYVKNAILGIVIVMYAATVPYFFVLWQSWKLLVLIDKNMSFSMYSVKAFRTIKYASLIGSLLLVFVFVPLLYPIAEEGDAPGILIFGFIFACIPFVVSVFAAVLEKLFQNTVDMKTENELTI